jgi:hypothetical protein
LRAIANEWQLEVKSKAKGADNACEEEIYIYAFELQVHESGLSLGNRYDNKYKDLLTEILNIACAYIHLTLCVAFTVCSGRFDKEVCTDVGMHTG